MTSPPLCLTVASSASEQSLRTRRKAVFTCPRCSHASPYDGDWEYIDEDDRTVVRCPSCHEQISVRPE